MRSPQNLLRRGADPGALLAGSRTDWRYARASLPVLVTPQEGEGGHNQELPRRCRRQNRDTSRLLWRLAKPPRLARKQEESLRRLEEAAKSPKHSRDTGGMVEAVHTLNNDRAGARKAGA